MKKTFIFLAMAILLLACGSDDSNNLTGGVSITCADASNISGEICSGFREARLAALDLPTAIFNAGDIGIHDTVYYSVEATNGAPTPARIYWLINASTVAGCESLNLHIESYPTDIPASALTIFNAGGTIFDICAELGPSYASIAVYNASHLADDVHGDPATDEVLSKAELHWNFIE